MIQLCSENWAKVGEWVDCVHAGGRDGGGGLTDAVMCYNHSGSKPLKVSVEHGQLQRHTKTSPSPLILLGENGCIK